MFSEDIPQGGVIPPEYMQYYIYNIIKGYCIIKGCYREILLFLFLEKEFQVCIHNYM
jgi:hypothetical protein